MTYLALGRAADVGGALGGTSLVRLAVEAEMSAFILAAHKNALDEQEQVAGQKRAAESSGTLGSRAVTDRRHEGQVLVDKVGVTCNRKVSVHSMARKRG